MAKDVGLHYYDLDNNLISQEEWVELFKTDERFLAETHFQCPSGEATASTVWVGLGLNPFETMLFCNCGTSTTETYVTRKDALEGHRAVLVTHGVERRYVLTNEWQWIV